MLTPIGWIFSIAILMLGLSAAFGGTFIMVGVLAVGFIANLLIRPVNERFHETTDRHTRFERERPVEMPTMERS